MPRIVGAAGGTSGEQDGRAGWSTDFQQKSWKFGTRNRIPKGWVERGRRAALPSPLQKIFYGIMEWVVLEGP